MDSLNAILFLSKTIPNMKTKVVFFSLFLFFNYNSYSQTHLNKTLEYLQNNKEEFSFTEQNARDWIVKDNYTTKHNGVEHIYLQQAIQGIPIEYSISNINVSKEGKILNVNNKFVPIPNTSINLSPTISAKSALDFALADLNVSQENVPRLISESSDVVQTSIFSPLPKAMENIKCQLHLFNLGKKGIKLTWKVRIEENESSFNVWNVYVDAQNGDIIHKKDMVIRCDFGHPNHKHDESCNHIQHNVANDYIPMAAPKKIAFAPDSYEAYPLGIESPNHGARTVLVNPADPNASPYGWHDTNGATGAEYTITRGNNVYAQEDSDGDNATFGFSPDGGTSLDFLFTQDLSQNPSTNTTVQNLSSSITNLFVWNNFMHDVWYNYGFDEVSGNYQENNYGNGGAGSDFVIADCQDDSGSNNANFSPQEDGTNGRMQMYMWSGNPFQLDGSLDNGIVSHEYGHGISNRLAGGPNSAFCLTNSEQAGEGWSDFFSLVMTHEEGDTRTTGRGIGTYADNQSPFGVGIRTYRYTTDMNVNPHTYDDIKWESVPHGVGSVMCAMLWDIYWDLIDVYGYDPDFYNGTGGNNIAMQLVIDGLKLQPCGAGFADVRDAIILADEINNGGSNYCLLWKAFARRGLGAGAIQGSPETVADGIESFDLPANIKGVGIEKTSDVTGADPDDVITYTLTFETRCDDQSGVVITDVLPENMTYVEGSASDGGIHDNGTITWPSISSFTAGSSQTYTYQTTVNSDVTFEILEIFNDDMENGPGNWQTSNVANLSNWELISTAGGMRWFAEELEADPLRAENQYLTMGPITLDGISELSFFHKYDTEVNWDGGTVEISIDGGASWIDLKDHFTENGYNDYTQNSPTSEAFSGNSVSFITSKVDLSEFCGEDALIRFNFYYDQLEDGRGWLVDDVVLIKSNALINIATAATNVESSSDANCVKINGEGTPVPTESLEENNVSVSLFPNPSHGDEIILSIQSDAIIGEMEIKVFNISGQLIQSNNKTVQGNNISFDFLDRKLAAGIYSVQIISEGINTIEKFIVL